VRNLEEQFRSQEAKKQETIYSQQSVMHRQKSSESNPYSFVEKSETSMPYKSIVEGNISRSQEFKPAEPVSLRNIQQVHSPSFSGHGQNQYEQPEPKQSFLNQFKRIDQSAHKYINKNGTPPRGSGLRLQNREQYS